MAGRSEAGGAGGIQDLARPSHSEVVKQDLKVEDGKVVAYRTRVMLSFKYQK